MLPVLLLTGLLLVAVDDPPAAGMAEDVAQLIIKLDSRELNERDAAEKKLIELGPGALPHLTINEQTSAQVAQRLQRVQQKLLSDQAEQSAKPTIVTLQGSMPLADVFAAITMQTGNPIVDHRGNFGQPTSNATLNLDLDKVTFWEAMDKVLDQGRLTLYPYTGKRAAGVVNRGDGDYPRVGKAQYTGLFRLEPLRLESRRDLRNDSLQSLKFYMEATWEPRVQPIALMQPLVSVKAEDEAGNKISVTSEGAEPEAVVREGMSAVELEVPLELPARGATKIKKLTGKIIALVPGPMEDFRFKNLPISTRNAPGKKVEQRKAGTLVSIDQVRKNNDSWEVALRVKFDTTSSALESHRGWVLDNEAFFLDSKGAKVESGSYEQTRQTRDEVGISYFFTLKDSPDKLEFVYRTPVTILEQPVEYEFHDLPLP